MIKTIITFIIVFGILVIVHEFGHFYFAKRGGILVREFSIGMGPKLVYHRGKDGTTYTLRLLPVGGYVRMAGAEDDEEELKPGTPVSLFIGEHDRVERINTSKKSTLFNGIPLEVTATDLENELWIEGYENGDESAVKRYAVDHDATIIESDGTELRIAPKDVQFPSASLGRRLMTNFAGPMNNVLLAIVTFMLMSVAQGGVATGTNQVQVASSPVSVAQTAGVKTNDKIVAVNGKATKDWTALSQAIQPLANKQTTLTIQRDGKTQKLTVTPKGEKSNGKTVGMIGITQAKDKNVGAILLSGFTQTWTMTKLLFGALWHMVSGHFSLNDLGGPVAIFATTSQATQFGLVGILNFLAFLSLNLAIVNLLPIPALDGGKILLNLIEAVRRKPLSENVEAGITLVGVAFLVLLMLLVTWNDIERYFIR
ncbi:zinc metalloprotease [Levilactobacillus zymae]|uniref:Zinc metalloprotease n=1 Tax=Levilactobacillus zymae TaxID=267363 RepID=A0ABQ0WVI6_9LACO|nr:RIP metalloprotease RseP [Levilactobacillus zymae]KRL15507.1 membrane-associated Zn-dependent protease 1 [Levilactobacillus zymae DSM 19395]QFR60825.1 RIP metalloprotease RseP [Levilactobacillus zymae]GEO71046.1 zinc metalloprotease [Levilactobacillus zymae]